VSGPSPCAQIRPELGVYVLGAIAPADRARVSRHLASCPGCREELAGLAGLPALLRAVPAATALQLSGERPPDPSGPLVDGLIGRVAAFGRPRWWSLAAAAAVLVAAAAAGWAAQVLHAAAPRRAGLVGRGGRGVQRRHQGPCGGALHAAALRDRAGGQRQRHPARHPLPDLGYHRQRHQAADGGWTVTRGDPHAWYPASVALPAGSLDGFDITAGGKILVAIPLRPGTPNAAAAPTSIP